MTATAQGTALLCDYAGCKQPSTIDIDAWAYCAEHAGRQHLDAAEHSDDAALAFTAKEGWDLQPSPTVAAAVTQAQDRRAAASAAPARPTAPAKPAAGIGLLLEDASAHSNPRVRRAAERIEKQLDDLRALVRELAADEAKKKAAAAAKAKARADVERLERELAAAKAALRGKATTTAPAKRTTGGRPQTSSSAAGTATSSNPCTSCSGPVTRPAGTRGAWASRCDTCKAA